MQKSYADTPMPSQPEVASGRGQGAGAQIADAIKDDLQKPLANQQQLSTQIADTICHDGGKALSSQGQSFTTTMANAQGTQSGRPEAR